MDEDVLTDCIIELERNLEQAYNLIETLADANSRLRRELYELQRPHQTGATP